MAKISKELINDIVEINQIIFSNDYHRLGMNDIAVPYNRDIKPKLELFKKKYGNTPQSFLKTYLNAFKKAHLVSDNIKVRAFGHWGRSIHNYCWCTFYLSKDTQQAFSNTIQIYIVIDHTGVKFGLGYGDKVDDSFSEVIDVKNDNELTEKLFSIINKNNAQVFKIEPGSAEIPYETHLDVDRLDDLRKIWDSRIHILKTYRYTNLKDDLNEEVEVFFIDLINVINSLKVETNEKVNKPKKIKYWLYAPGENASHWDEFYESGIMGLGWDEIGDLNELGSRKDIASKIKETYNTKTSAMNDALANYEFRDVISVGDIVIPKRGRKKYIGYGVVASDYIYESDRNTYQKIRKVNWVKKGIWEVPERNIVLKTLTDITKYPDYVKELIELIGIESENPTFNEIENKLPFSKNTIFYGPPGTGKTYKLKNELFKHFTDFVNLKSKEDYLKELVDEYSWWEVIGAALIDKDNLKVSELFKHPLIEAKSAMSSNKHIRATLWGTLQAHTTNECEFVNVSYRQAPLIFNKTKDSKWQLINDVLNEEAPEIIELNQLSKKYQPQTEPKKRYVFTTFHQSIGYEDFIEGIKPVTAQQKQNDEQINSIEYEIRDGIFKKIVNQAKEDLDNNYAIFIDEINRGNVSSIFGELITLIEEDKRLDEENYIPVKLPYSGEDFGVPPNLYIFGTMNTADRSVEALDTALRRRFSFSEMNPKPKKLSDPNFKCDGINLEKMLESINLRIEKLLEKDYRIGHSYFMNIENRRSPLAELKVIFKNKILPLLQEYFYGDWGKIILVVGKNFVDVKEDEVSFLDTNLYDDFEEYMNKTTFRFTKTNTWTLESFKSIYE